MFNFKKKKANFQSPMSGTVLELCQVPDPVFSSKMMGDGFAVELQDSDVVAPFNGTVLSTFPTGHAYGLVSDDGLEVLLHIGLDTVELNGKGFHPMVKIGDHVKQGDVLLNLDLHEIRDHGKSLISPIIFTKGETVQSLLHKNETITTLEDIAYLK